MSVSTPITAPEIERQVAVGLLQGPKDQVLISQRLAGVHLAGLWEFPGGKIEHGELPVQALQREWTEELGVRVHAAAPILSIAHTYPERRLRLQVYRILSWSGTPQGREGQVVRWVPPAELRTLAFPPASQAIVHAACLPKVYAITPDPQHPARIPDVLAALEGRLSSEGLRLLQIRAPSLTQAAFYEYAGAVLDLARRYGCATLLNAPQTWFAEIAASHAPQPLGWHLSEARLLALSERPACAGWLAASVHNEAALQQAMRLPVDFVVISPVRSTPTHPEVQPIGFVGLRRLLVASSLPVFALGGLMPQDVSLARAVGAQGIAGIRLG